MLKAETRLTFVNLFMINRVIREFAHHFLFKRSNALRRRACGTMMDVDTYGHAPASQRRHAGNGMPLSDVRYGQMDAAACMVAGQQMTQRGAR